ncbi:Flp pilus assembly protein protease CpaA [Kitasatospora sp. MAA4]|uniref:hypothetical protein n=1 Tax=Kitasatospora sp. MAA4 TaxID=3035093 RepID=UPI002473D293|nr:hypothetical protein [Kitasatospora sp. MAA4]MDH6135808.1 Flp pilus assembly protein protease CpaA [Kitasatospora sp. MAA4]
MKQVAAAVVVGLLALAALVAFVAEWDSTRNDASILGGAAFTAFLVFFALGWTKRNKAR